MPEERGPRKIEWTLLTVVAVMAAFGVLATGGIRAVDFAILELLMVAALALSIVRLWVHEKPVFHVSPLFWSVVAFCGYVLIRFFTADVPYLAEDELSRVLFYVALFVILTFHLFRHQYQHVMLVVVGTVAVGGSLYAAYQYFSGSNMVWHFLRPETYSRRGSGTFINPNNFAGYVAVLLPMMAAVVVAGRVSVTTRFLAGYAAVMFLTGLAVSASRGGVIAGAGGLLALTLMLVRKPAFRMPAMILLAFVLLGAFAVFARGTLAQRRFEDIQRTSLGTDTRIQLWQSAEQMWRDHFWLGAGPAHYDAVFPQYRPDLLQQRQPYFVHNEYLNTLADYGLIGALLVLTAFVCLEFAWRYGTRNLRRDAPGLDGSRSNRLALLMGAAAGITAALIHAFFDYNFHMPAYALLIIFFMSIVAVSWRADNERWWWRPRIGGKMLLTILSLALAGWFGVHAKKRWVEARLLAQVKKTDFQSTEYLPALEAAAQADPKNSRTLYDIGEYHRAWSWEGGAGHKEAGQRALEAFAKAARMNPHDSYIPLRQAMTLIWLEEGSRATPYLAEAERLNPTDYYTLAHIGWCYFQMENYQQALGYFERSMQLRGYGNNVAETYLPITRERVREAVPANPNP